MNMESHGGMILAEENLTIRRKTRPIVILFTINPTWTDPSVNPALRGERQATNRLNHGTVCCGLTVMQAD
jgi:hypothetical protein